MKRKIAEFIVAGILFLVLILFPPQGLWSGFIGGITGNVVFESSEDAQTAVQQILRDELFSSVKDGAKICLNIRKSEEEIYSFKIRKRGGFFEVRPSEVYCDGQSEEDFVFTFNSYADFSEFRQSVSLDYFLQDNILEKFHVWPSKCMETGGLMICNEEVLNYCDFISEHLSRNERGKLGISCCTADFEKPFGLFSRILAFLMEFWWLAALIVLVGVLGVGATFLLTRDETPPSEKYQGVVEYISKSREVGYNDFAIRAALERSGWDPSIIDSCFEKVRADDLTSLHERFRKDS